MTRPILIELGCEEIPARMIRAAADDLRRRVEEILSTANLSYGPLAAWGGSRRLAVRVESVQDRQADRTEQVLGPSVKAAYAADGSLTPAAIGFAKKQGVEPAGLSRLDTDRGAYVGFARAVPGRAAGEVLAAALPDSVRAMAFPKTMRWGSGEHRWVRPVHWLLALHGSELIAMELFGVASARRSVGHRFLHGNSDVEIPEVAAYAEALRGAYVVVDPAERRRRLADQLAERARAAGGQIVEDPSLLDEIADLVEWPGVVEGGFESSFLELPRELLITTLRHHQKSFCVESAGRLLPVFFSVANTDRDPAGHIRRGNEWVVTGRLQDARFFWDADRKATLASRSAKLGAVVFHARCGSYADKSERMARLAAGLADELGLPPALRATAVEAARLAKNDLTTDLVGEFPELQGVVGGLLLRFEGQDPELCHAVYEHYRPAGASDPIPESVAGSLASVVDRLDTVAALLQAGEAPTGSKDPFGLRRGLNGVFRIVEERRWPLSVRAIAELTGGSEAVAAFLRERFVNYLRDSGFSQNEILAVLRPRVNPEECWAWPILDIRARLAAIGTVRGRKDFERLVDLTKRVDNILTKGADEIARAAERARSLPAWTETDPTAARLEALLDRAEPLARDGARDGRYQDTVEVIAGLIEPVDQFFQDVLVLDPDRPEVTAARARLLAGKLKPILVSYFDLRELAGQAD